MAGKKSQNGSRSDSEGTTEARRAPMREFSRSLPMSLLRAREAVMRQFRPSLRNHGLTEQQWRILRALTAVDTIEVTELARVAFLLGPSLSRILRDLEARDLIERRTAKADLRRGEVSISSKGLKLIEAVGCLDAPHVIDGAAMAPASLPNCRTCWLSLSVALRKWKWRVRQTPRPTSKRKFA